MNTFLNYTNAATLINPGFNFDQITGMFNGWNPETNSYSLEPDSWDYQYEINSDGTKGKPKPIQRFKIRTAYSSC